jgi:hypothetical protein
MLLDAYRNVAAPASARSRTAVARHVSRWVDPLRARLARMPRGPGRCAGSYRSAFSSAEAAPQSQASPFHANSALQPECTNSQHCPFPSNLKLHADEIQIRKTLQLVGIKPESK